jgi:hypothetical protein
MHQRGNAAAVDHEIGQALQRVSAKGPSMTIGGMHSFSKSLF